MIATASCRRLPAALCLSAVAALLAGRRSAAQEPVDAAIVQQGTFRLHKFAQAIGEEHFVLSREGDGLLLETRFQFVDRGSPVNMKTTLHAAADLTPRHLTVKGGVSRMAAIDAAVDVADGADGGIATVRLGKTTREVPLPAHCFAIRGYAPVALQMLLVRYCREHAVDGALPTLLGGDVTLTARGRDTLELGDRKLELERYSLAGLIWGRETLWVDGDGQLVALVGVDGEVDHFEAVREDCAAGLETFITLAAQDSMRALADQAAKLSPARPAVLAITGGTVIDGTGAPPLVGATVVVADGRIRAIGPAAKTPVPAGATVLDATGAFVLPGLWDMHAHYEQVEWGAVYLAAGVTTVRDCGNELAFVVAVRDAIANGTGLGPRLLLAGLVDGTSRTSLGSVRADDAAGAAAAVALYHTAGCQQIKVYGSVKRDVLGELAKAAHAVGMTVTGHVPNGLDAVQCLDAGMDQINHIEYLDNLMRGQGAGDFDPDAPEAKRTIELLKQHGTVVDPTLAVFEWMMHPRSVAYTSIEPGAATVPDVLRDGICGSGVPDGLAVRMQRKLKRYIGMVGALHRAGVPIVAGTDQVVPGHSIYRELELYVQAGLTPLEAIQAATLVPARVMHLDAELGTLAPGKLADLIVVAADPLADIANLRRVRDVVTGGRVYACADLWTAVGFRP